MRGCFRNLDDRSTANGFSRKKYTVVDCTEIYIETPSSLAAQSITWSSYKHHNTVKYLICIRNDGGVCLISRGFGGRSSDQLIFKKSLDSVLKMGDVLLADRGFNVNDYCRQKGVRVDVPPSAPPKGQQFEQGEAERTKKIANVRIHVERVIGRLKTFKILQDTLETPILPLLDNIVTIVGALCNMRKRMM